MEDCPLRSRLSRELAEGAAARDASALVQPGTTTQVARRQGMASSREETPEVSSSCYPLVN